MQPLVERIAFDDLYHLRIVIHGLQVIKLTTVDDSMDAEVANDMLFKATASEIILRSIEYDPIDSPDLNELSKTLIAFAMQKYYEETTSSPGYKKELFTDLTTAGTGSNGIQFDMADVSDKFAAAFQNNEKLNLKDAKGFDLYFKNYLQQSLFTTTEQQLIQSLLPYLRDWYVQAGTSGMLATDTQNPDAYTGGDDRGKYGSYGDWLLGQAGGYLNNRQLTGCGVLVGAANDDNYDPARRAA